MYLILEYLTYIFVVSVLGAMLFGASAMLLVTKEGAKHLTEISKRIAAHAVVQITNRFEVSFSQLPQSQDPVHQPSTLPKPT